ncbi:hypothetical protein K7395_32260 [Streptomyces filamentosus]|uniref:Secreted protein n=1 Tax=Streptomyces filamentosus TaxID=67294 RepID=A0ABY4V3F0_STRFL|nr:MULTISPECIES: hypothetical protein [Streptomyces]ESU51970.1 hypothetical protein P376_0046 [Streptomyces sp. HCCB10043]MYR77252.1 hypothetical protein [Streptomyces sp. SID5466]USC51076.1 hypothetical protein K7395_32260 [Streptomyces filamentosus]
MIRPWRIVLIVVGVACIAATPLVWLLNGPGTGELVGASLQAGTGVAALVWVWSQPRQGDSATDTGQAKASRGGSAHTGIRRPGGVGAGSARVDRTGAATADGVGSSAGTGIDHSKSRGAG